MPLEKKPLTQIDLIQTKTDAQPSPKTGRVNKGRKLAEEEGKDFAERVGEALDGDVSVSGAASDPSITLAQADAAVGSAGGNAAGSAGEAGAGSTSASGAAASSSAGAATGAAAGAAAGMSTGAMIGLGALGAAAAAGGGGGGSSSSSGNTVAGSTTVVTHPSLVITDNHAEAKVNKAGGDIIYTFTFDEAVSGFDASKVSVANGSKGAFTVVSAKVYTLVVTPNANFEGDVSVNVAAGAGNSVTNGGTSLAATQALQTVDTKGPTLVITDSKNGVLASADGDITYTFTFDQAVTGFDASKVSLDHGTKGAFNAVSGTVYTLVVTPTSMEGNMTVSVAANAAVDNSGNGNLAVQSVQAVDTVAPTATNVTLNGAKDALTITFTEHVTGVLNFVDFTVLVNGTPVTIASILPGADKEVVVQLNAPVLTGQSVQLTWTNSQAGAGTSPLTDNAGNGLNGFTLGTLADGYVRGASVYIDTNNNGQVDAGVDFYVGLTNQDGNFFIPQGAPTGTLIAIGGVNIDTGVPNTMPLKAPAGSTTVNPLTTLVQAVVEKTVVGGGASAQQIADAASQVATSLGITLDAGQSLTTYDPLAAGNVDAQKVAAQVATVVTLAGSADANGGSTVIDNLANTIQTNSGSGGVVNLADSNTLSSVLANVNTTAQQQSNIADAATTIGNATTLSQVSAAQSQFLDLIAPDMPVLSAAAVTNDNTPRVRVTLNTTDTTGKAVIVGDKLLLLENGVEISSTLSLTSADLKAGYVDVDANLLLDGLHNIRAVLVDQAGNRSDAAVSVGVTVDTAAPQAPALSGAITTDNLINAGEAQAGVAISGNAEAGSTVQLSIGAFSRSVTVDNAGVWTTTLSAADVAGIGQGAKTLSVVATDAAGNSSGATSASFSVDTLAPGATVTIAQALDNVLPTTGNIASGGTSNDNTLELSGAVTGAVSGDVVAIYDGAVRLGIASINAGAWTFTTPSLSNAAHALTARVEDAAGNAGTASSVYSVTVNASVPSATVTITAVTDDVPGGASSVANNGATNDNTPTLSGSISGQAQGDSVVVYEGGVRLGTATVNGNSWSYTLGSAASDGVHSYTAVVENSGGNQGTPSNAWAIKVDTAGPAAPTLTKVAGDDVVNLAEKTAGVVLSGTAESGSTVNITWGAASKSVVATNGNWSASFAGNEVPGDTDGSQIVVTATDAAGNVSANLSKTVTVDATAPTAAAFNTIAGDNQINASEAAAGTVISGTAEGAARIALTLATGNVKQIVADGDGNWTYTLTAADISAIGQGSKTLHATATDAAGNVSADATRSLAIDTAAPTLTPLALQAASDSGTKGDGRSNVTAPVLEFTAEANADLWVDYGNGTFVNTGLKGTGALQTLTIPAEAMSQDGTYAFRLKAIDAAGNESSARQLGYTRDTAAPNQTQILSVEDDVGALRGNLANNSFTDDTQLLVRGTTEAFAKVQVLNGSTVLGSATADAKGAWSLLTSTLVNGSSYNLSAVATDAAGNVGQASASLAVTVDTLAPSAPVIANVATDNIINALEKSAGVAVNGTAEAGSTVVVTWGANSKTVTATGGNWTANFAANEVPIDGPSSIRAVATDAAGNASGEGTRALTLDSVAPSTPVVNTVAGDNVVNLAEKTAGVSVSGTAEANASVLVSWGNASKTTTADANGVYSVNFSANEVPADADASSISAVATDAAGNASAARSVTVAIDSIAPNASLAITGFEDNAPSSSVVILGPDAITNDNTPTLRGSITGTLGTGERIAVYENAARLGYAEPDQQGGWRFTPPVADNGTHTYSARVEDAAGNVGASSASFSLTVDATPPNSVATITGITDDIGRVRTPVASGGSSDDTLPTLQGNIVGTQQTGDTVKLYDKGVLLGSAAVIGNTWSFTPQSPLPEGSHSFTAVVENAAGTSSAPSETFAYTLDLSAPTAPAITAVQDDQNPQTGVVGIGGSTNDTTLLVEGTAEANVTVEVFEGNTVLGSATADADGKWSLTTTALSQGQHALSARAIDAVGNVSPASDSRSVIVDTDAPIRPSLDDVAQDGIINATEKAAGVTVSGSAEGNAAIEVNWGGLSLHTQADVDGKWSVKFSAAQVPATEGQGTIQAWATDAAGNTSGVGKIFPLIDTVAPDAPVIASVSGDDQVNANEKNQGVTVEGTAEAASMVTVSWGSSSHTVEADGSGNWSASFSSGEIPQDGNSTISAVAADQAGNGSAGTSHAVKIDTVAPTVGSINAVAGNDIVNAQEKAEGVSVSGNADADSTVSLSWGSSTVSGKADADGKWSFDFAANKVPGDGAGQITLTVTDGAGNSIVTSRTVTVASSLPTNTTQISAIVDDAPGGASNPGNGGIGNDTSPLLQGSYTGTLANGAVIAVFDGATRLGNATLEANNQWSFQASSLEAGSHNFSVRVVDGNGNAGSSSTSFAYTLDVSAPGTPQIQALTGDNVINASEQSAVLSGSAEALSTVSLNLGGQTHTVNANVNGTWTYTLNADDVAALMEDGSITAVAQDAAGNASQAASIAVSVDLSAPQVQMIEAPAGLQLRSSEAGKVVLNGTQVGVLEADQLTTLSAQTSASLGQLSVVDAAGNVGQAGTAGLGSAAGDALNGSGQTQRLALYGFEGNDSLTGGSGNDVLVGGAGNDTIEGGGGVDTALFQIAAGSDSPLTYALDGEQVVVLRGEDIVARIARGANNSSFQIMEANGSGFGNDTVSNVQRLDFVDSGNDQILSLNAGELNTLLPQLLETSATTRIDWSLDRSEQVLLAGDSQIRIQVHFSEPISVQGAPLLNLTLIDDAGQTHILQAGAMTGPTANSLDFVLDVQAGVNGRYHVSGFDTSQGRILTANGDMLADLSLSTSNVGFTVDHIIYGDILAGTTGTAGNDLLDPWGDAPESVISDGKFVGIDGGAGNRDLLVLPVLLTGVTDANVAATYSLRYAVDPNTLVRTVQAYAADGTPLAGSALVVPANANFPANVEGLAFHIVYRDSFGDVQEVDGAPLLLYRNTFPVTDPVAQDDFFIQGSIGSDSITVNDSNAGHRYLIRASTGNDTIVGHAGADIVFGEGGNDSISTGDGNDRIFIGGGNDTVDGGNGDDALVFNLPGQHLDVVGGASGMVLVSHTGFWMDGQFVDTAPARAAYVISFNDAGQMTVLDLAAGTTTLASNIERLEVRMLGGDERRTLYFGSGTAGNDIAEASPQAPIQLGLGGNDQLSANGDKGAVLYGGSGDDTLQGGSGDDILVGGADNDFMLGDWGDDTLAGEAGDDLVDGGMGFDRAAFLVKADGAGPLEKRFDEAQNAWIISQGGNDLAKVTQGTFGALLVQDLTVAGPNWPGFGTDTVRNVENLSFAYRSTVLYVDTTDLTFIQQPSQTHVDWTQDNSSLVLIAGDDTLEFVVHFNNPVWVNGKPVLNLSIVDGATTLQVQAEYQAQGQQFGGPVSALHFSYAIPEGTRGQYHIDGLALPTDASIVDAQIDQLPANLAITTASAITAGGYIYPELTAGGSGLNDAIGVYEMDPTSVPTNGDFSAVNGGAGDRDLLAVPLVLPSSFDSQLAVAGVTMRYVAASGNVPAHVIAIGANGTPIDGVSVDVPSTFPQGVEGLVYHLLFQTAEGYDNVPGNPLILTKTLATWSDPVNPNDLYVQGTLGNDSIDVSTDSNANHRYLIRASVGNDTLIGHNGSDVLVGEGGNDSMLGGAGNDRLFVSGGLDTLDGGADFDRLSFNLPGQDVRFNGFLSGAALQNLNNGLAGPNSYILSADDSGMLRITNFGDRTQVSTAVNMEALELRMGGSDLRYEVALQKGDADDNVIDNSQGVRAMLIGGGGNDALSASNQGDVIFAGSGNDSLQGGFGDDLLYGDAGNDMLNGGGGTNYLVGGAGNDTLIGGFIGNDTAGFALKGSGTLAYLHDTDADAYFITQAGVRVARLFTTGGSWMVQDLSDLVNGFGSDNVMGLSKLLFGNSGGQSLTVDLKQLTPTEGRTAWEIPLHGTSGNDSLVAGNWDAHLYGEDGDDTLTAGGGFAILEGGAGNDTLIGGTGETDFIGGAGNDRLDSAIGTGYAIYEDALLAVTVNLATGTASGVEIGSDTLIGIEGVAGGAGNDSLTGSDGNDSIAGHGGNDVINGGAGSDTVFYEDAETGVTVNLSGGTFGAANGPALPGSSSGIVASGAAFDGLGGTDTLIQIENIVGSNAGDILVGSNSANYIDGGHGSDTIRGNGGNDTLDGGVSSLPGVLATQLSEYDWVDYRNASSVAGAVNGVTVNLNADSITGFGSATGAAPASSGTSAFSHKLKNFEAVMGSGLNDSISGDTNSNMLRGGGGDDTIDGGGGLDWADYLEATGAGVNVDLVAGTAVARVGGSSGSDTLISIERVRGTNFDDSLLSDNGNNVIRAMGGNNVVDGRDGVDLIDYVQAAAGVIVDMSVKVNGAFTVANVNYGNGVTGTDIVSNVEGVQGSRFNDSIKGDANDNIFNSFGGNDTLDGGANGSGGDTVNYQFATSALNANLATGTASVNGWGTDQLSNIENITGTEFNDVITGDDANNLLNGGNGNDLLDGGQGDDTLIGGGGADTLIGGAGNDAIDLGVNGFGNFPGSMVKMNSLNDGVDTVSNFSFNDPAYGGDVIDLSNIAHLGSNTKVQQFYGGFPQSSAAMGDNNVFIFNNTGMTQDQAKQMVADAANVNQQEGYLIFKDADHGGQATIFHSADLANGGALQALVVLSGTVDLQMLHQTNLIL